MTTDEQDVLCRKILDALNRLDTLLTGDVTDSAFDIEKNATSYETHHELTRLRRSLAQYAEKNPALLYVGFLGHFSSGKSSTINSLLGTTEIPSQRLTGLHPTDRVVTLITHPRNSNDLIGTHTRGDLEIGSSVMENDILETRVVVDTPGAGDPLVLQEMVRDFLPICDRLIYMFSAAIPLDRTDLPILEKVRNELPFIPTAFIVTRADEFRKDLLRPLSEDNFDGAKADIFVSELISRLAAAVKSFNITQDDVLMIDNVTGFNTDKLSGFVFPPPGSTKDTTMVLHAHKIAYYARSAKRMRDFFISYLKEKIRALDMLLTAARDNHAHFRETVTMANSRLTESWSTAVRTLTRQRAGQTEWVTDLESFGDPAATLVDVAPLAKRMGELRESIAFWADAAALTVCRSLKGKLSARLLSHMSSLRDQVASSTESEVVPLQPCVVANLKQAGLLEFEVEAPSGIAGDIRRMPDRAAEFIRDRATGISRSAKRLSDSILDRRLVAGMEATQEDSIRQLRDMLDDFFQSVRIYRSAILALNARELAEKVGVVRAIEEVERAEIREDKRQSWLAVLIERVFPQRREAIEHCEKGLAEVQSRLTSVIDEARRLRGVQIPLNLGASVEDRLALPQPRSDDQVVQAVQAVVNAFNDAASSLLEALNIEREAILEKHRTVLGQRVTMIRRRRLRKLWTFGIAGSVVGILAYVGFVFWKQPFQQNVTAVVLVGVLADALFAWAGWSFARLTDKTTREIEEENTEHARISRTITEELLKRNRSIGDWEFIDRLRPTLKTVISGQWASAAEELLRQHVVQPFEQLYGRLTEISSVFETAKSEYMCAAGELTSSLSAVYQRTDENLKALAEVSAEIQQQAIEPSFSMLQECSDRLRRKLEELQSLEISW